MVHLPWLVDKTDAWHHSCCSSGYAADSVGIVVLVAVVVVEEAMGLFEPVRVGRA